MSIKKQKKTKSHSHPLVALLGLINLIFGLQFLSNIFAITSYIGDPNAALLARQFVDDLTLWEIASAGGFITLTIYLLLCYVLRQFIDWASLRKRSWRLALIAGLLIILGALNTLGARTGFNNLAILFQPTVVQTEIPMSTEEPRASESASPENAWITQSFGDSELDTDFWEKGDCDSGIVTDQRITGSYRFYAEQTTSFLGRICFLNFKGDGRNIDKVAVNLSYESGIGGASYVGIFSRCGNISMRMLVDSLGVRPKNGVQFGQLLRDYGASGKTGFTETLIMQWDGEYVTFTIANGQLPSISYPCNSRPSSLQFGVELSGTFGIDTSLHRIEIWGKQ